MQRMVVLKFLPQALTSDKETRDRFIREARAASALDHPNICTIYEIDETDDGRMFMAMGCYEGETIKEKIDFLELYEWSSYRQYIGRGIKWGFIRSDEVLNMFSAHTKRARKEYRNFVLKGLSDNLSSPFKNIKGQLVLGNPSFERWVYNNFIKGIKKKFKNVSGH